MKKHEAAEAQWQKKMRKPHRWQKMTKTAR